MTDYQRQELVRLIHQDGCSIAKASKLTAIPYDNAKAINRTYLKERRVHKINYRQRYHKKSSLSPQDLCKQNAVDNSYQSGLPQSQPGLSIQGA